jgi:hypothetical protein
VGCCCVEASCKCVWPCIQVRDRYSIPSASIRSPTIEDYLGTRLGRCFLRRSAPSGRVSTTFVTLRRRTRLRAADNKSVPSTCPTWEAPTVFTANHGRLKPLLNGCVLPRSCSSQALDAGSIPVTRSIIRPSSTLSFPWSSAVRKIRVPAGGGLQHHALAAYRVRASIRLRGEGVGLRWSLH